LFALYRGHNNNFINFKNRLGELLSRIKTKKIIIIGDININISKNSSDEYKTDILTLWHKWDFIAA